MASVRLGTTAYGRFQFECSLYERLAHNENARCRQRRTSREERVYGAPDLPWRIFLHAICVPRCYVQISMHCYRGVAKVVLEVRWKVKRMEDGESWSRETLSSVS
jgi:hypothetical protein